MTARDTDWDGVRLHVVTGKGGTGKTTVAAALALALAHAGRKVLLIEAEGRQGIARLFDRPPLPYEERKIAIGPGEADDGRDPGGDVYALAIDPEGAQGHFPRAPTGLRQGAAQWLEQRLQGAIDRRPGHDRLQEVDGLHEDRRRPNGQE